MDMLVMLQLILRIDQYIVEVDKLHILYIQ